MSTPSFNLVDEPWISVRSTDRRSALVSLRELFHRAPTIRRIAGELPTQDFAVLRIALAVMYRALDTDENVDEIWESGTLPLDEIDEYLDRWHHRFDLFDGEHPFMQVAGLKSVSGDTKPLGILMPDSPGPGHLFTMRHDIESVSFAEAARWLVHCQAYDFDGIKTGALDDPRTKGGKGYPVGIGWAGWLGGLYLEGHDLRETLLHNWVPSRESEQRRDDLALWELDPLTPAPRDLAEIGPFGPAGLFTWPIRHIRLIPGDGRVNRVLICIGDPVAKAVQMQNEPMTSWRYSDPQTKKEKSSTPLYMPRKHDPTWALWRGLASLLPTTEPPTDTKGIVSAHPSMVVSRLAERIAEDKLPNRLVALVSVGVEYGSQMSTYSQIFSDNLVVHPTIAKAEGAARACVVDAIKRTYDAVSALSGLAGDLAVTDGGKRPEAAERARATAYAALDQHFRAWVQYVGDHRDTSELSNAWYGMATDVLSALADTLLDSASPRSRAVRIVDGHPVSAGQAANWFRYNLSKHLPVTRKDTAI
ncbi:MAG: type I-E CRISPR-associated protein Cse1/CasA [Gordonia sp. (in: high G+C Gram-positive bacteria)]|uniref:type I-E CRISPR-associated protein Cse1/CasA n=1 Tax=Gordonia sp. (in: high G+C Gram-positive bacteria) TaxID=84139 RepID=UPI0039E52A24